MSDKIDIDVHCQDCKFFNSNVGPAGCIVNGECRFRAPVWNGKHPVVGYQPHDASKEYELNTGTSYIFPVVGIRDWCGDFQMAGDD